MAKSTTCRRCSGMTVVELLVVMAIVAVLMGVVLPAVHGAREAARKIHCSNNLRNLALGIHQWALLHGRFPEGSRLRRESGVSLSISNWSVAILPWIDQQSISERWDHNEVSTAGRNLELARTHVSVFACPSDISLAGGGDQSYCVNGGIGVAASLDLKSICVSDALSAAIDLNGDGMTYYADMKFEGEPTDLALCDAMRLFLVRVDGVGGDPRRRTFASITDGSSNTLMIGENLRTGFNPRVPNRNWASAETAQSFFFLSPEICANHSCVPQNVDLHFANSGAYRMNCGTRMAEGESPFLSASHSGGVYAAFADGHVSFIAEDIAGIVLFDLFTPRSMDLHGTPFVTSPSD